MAAMSPSGCLSVVLNARATPEDMLKAYFQCVVFWEKVRLGLIVVGVGDGFGDGDGDGGVAFLLSLLLLVAKNVIVVPRCSFSMYRPHTESLSQGLTLA